MKASKIFLLLGLLGFGASVETAWQLKTHVGAGPLGWVVLGGRFRGPHFSFESTETREVPAGTPVDIENAFGAVDVKAGEPGKVEVKLGKVVYQPNEARARELADKLKILATLEGGRLRITTNRQELDGTGQIRFGWDAVAFETNLTVRVPPETAAGVRNAHGRVDVADVATAQVESSYDDVRIDRVKGGVTATARHGDLAASNLGGDVEITVRHGDLKVADAAGRVKISGAHGDITTARTGPLDVEIGFGDLVVETVRGNLDVRGQHAEVRAADVSGGASVVTSYEDVTLANVGGDARAKAEHGAVKCSEIKGALVTESSFNDTRLDDVAGRVEATVSHGGFHAKRLLGGVVVKTEGDDIVLDGFKGAVQAEAKRGGVKLRPAGPITDAITASAAFGDVRLEVPEASHFELTAAAEQGDLALSLPGLAVTESGKRRISGRMGAGGARVQLDTSHGDVMVSSGGGLASN